MRRQSVRKSRTAHNSRKVSQFSNFNFKNGRSNNFRVILPEDIEIGFEEVIGHNECKRELSVLLSFLQNPTLYEEAKIFPYCKYLMIGPNGVGKSTLVASIAKTVKVPLVSLEPSFFYDTDNLLEEVDNLFEEVHNTIEKHGNCVLLLKELQYAISVIPEILQPMLEKLIGYFRELPQLVAFATLSTMEAEVELPRLFVEKPAFNKIIQFMFPEKQVREQIIESLIKELPVEKNINVSRMALDTYQMTIGDIKKLIRDAMLHAFQNGRKKLTYSDFAEALAQSTFGYITTKLDEEERIATARHEAGHVIAGYFSSPDTYKVSKVEITPRSVYLGITQETVDESKKSFFKKDLENQIISCLGGMASEEYYYKATTSGVANDLEQATFLAIQIHKIFGMCSEIGPICLFSSDFAMEGLEKKADILIQRYLKEMYNIAKHTISIYSSALEELTQALLDKEVVYSDEVIEILKKHQSKYS